VPRRAGGRKLHLRLQERGWQPCSNRYPAGIKQYSCTSPSNSDLRRVPGPLSRIHAVAKRVNGYRRNGKVV
jgi:hypothetical protein